MKFIPDRINVEVFENNFIDIVSAKNVSINFHHRKLGENTVFYM